MVLTCAQYKWWGWQEQGCDLLDNGSTRTESEFEDGDERRRNVFIVEHEQKRALFKISSGTNAPQSLRRYDSTQHTRLTTALKPDSESYKKMRQVVGEDQFFSTQILLIMVCIIQHCKQWRSSLAMCRTMHQSITSTTKTSDSTKSSRSFMVSIGRHQTRWTSNVELLSREEWPIITVLSKFYHFLILNLCIFS
ncbi:unnamed protein product [Cylicocyclus nassatus]|uniref:Uncharacterized protein n=1 Tax=Cylicocyclus nassatus TaxID=53992 RepID=A0AA36DNV7_CYLNA|nr:unnamed protein product [Cylicocyclus nassatus]